MLHDYKHLARKRRALSNYTDDLLSGIFSVILLTIILIYLVALA